MIITCIFFLQLVNPGLADEKVALAAPQSGLQVWSSCNNSEAEQPQHIMYSIFTPILFEKDETVV